MSKLSAVEDAFYVLPKSELVYRLAQIHLAVETSARQDKASKDNGFPFRFGAMEVGMREITRIIDWDGLTGDER